MMRLALPLVLVLLGAADAWIGFPNGAQPLIGYTEPAMNTDGTPLTNLSQMCFYWSLDGGFTTRQCVNASSATGGAAVVDSTPITVPVLPGEAKTLAVSVAATNTSGREGPQTVPVSLLINRVAEAPPPPSGSQVVLDTDTFSGVNGTALDVYSANWPVFANWNHLAIQSSPGVGPGVGGGQGARRTGQVWTSDQWAELVVDAFGAGHLTYVGVRSADDAPAGRGYMGGVGASGYHITRRNPDGTQIELAVAPGSAALAGDALNIQAVGSLITFKVIRGGTQLLSLSATDATYTSGTPMLFVCCGPASTQRYGGSWRAGSVTSGATAPPLPASDLAISFQP